MILPRDASLFCLFLTLITTSCTFASNQDANNPHQDDLLPPLESDFKSYPNLANITDEERALFHPILKFPTHFKKIPVLDCTQATGLATESQRKRSKIRDKLFGLVWRNVIVNLITDSEVVRKVPWKSSKWGFGKYDEDRRAMYTSSVFDAENVVDGYSGARTVHLGIDLGAPVGTKVYAFADGVVHSVGYNEGHGDYGFVVVIEHTLPLSSTKIWALYGHMDRATSRNKSPGTPIQKGQVIGGIGDCHENGGWSAPHCHFQVSMRPPMTHDMPGACSVQDRPIALSEYFDPRYVLGQIY
ncbi:unnamed protein product [Cylindrotheca closterium]|uniref:M23ase beta-sheet core domain-containing protein n=1 Tax=Cylindrotheca closterium TaxID=2856 RepID=A0AAD2JM34_9STRA|nr:unnamed protein product [Cylindrotheca closterium]